jgi:hypothetical protein
VLLLSKRQKQMQSLGFGSFRIGVEESKSNDKDERQGFFAALRMTTSIAAQNDDFYSRSE